MNLQKEKINSLLIVTLSNLGDVVLTLSVVASLRALLPKTAFSIITGARAYGLLKGNPSFSEVICYNKRESLTKKMQFILRLREKKFDYVLDFRQTLIPYLLGKPGDNLFLQWKTKKNISRYDKYETICTLLGLEKVKAPELLPLFSENDRNGLVKKLHSKGIFAFQNMLVCAPGARSKMKRWPVSSFAELLRVVAARERLSVVLVGDNEDKEITDAVESLLPSVDVVNLAGKISQKELAAIVSLSRLIITNDSAVMHMANYFIRPVVAIFGPTSVAKYGRNSSTARSVSLDISCVPCEKSSCPRQRECLEQLTPQQVLPSVIEVLKHK